MRNILIILIAFIFSINSNAQNFTRHLISNDTDHVHYNRGLFSADIDGDGDMDVIASSNVNDIIEWYENLDGLGNFSSGILISTQVVNPRGVFAADIDNDNDIDIISSSHGDDKIAWYENLDGLGTFGNQQIISTNAIAANAVKAADIDNDGDLDIVAACIGNKITWYENLDGLGNFGFENVITVSVVYPENVYAVDIDNDSDLDILTWDLGEDRIIWFENINGLGDFGPTKLVYAFPPHEIFQALMPADFDNDGDVDIAFTKMSDPYTTDYNHGWFENTNGSGQFVLGQLISSTLQRMSVGAAFDYDKDGDMDIITSGKDLVSNTSRFAIYPNDGNGGFGLKIDLGNLGNAERMHLADVNGDNNLDILFNDDTRLFWIKNLQDNLSIPENNTNITSISPNPTNGNLKVHSTLPIEKITIFNLFGQKVGKYIDNSEINISNLSNGFYIVKVQNSIGDIYMQKIIKK